MGDVSNQSMITAFGFTSRANVVQASGSVSKRKRSNSASDDDKPPSKSLRTSDSPSTTGEKAIKTSAAEFLNNLSSSEATNLDAEMRSAITITVTSSLLPSVQQSLTGLTGRDDGETHSGAWWLALYRCEIVGIAGNDHPRWQIDTNGTGPGSNMTKVRRALTLASLAIFRTLASAGTKKIVKLNCHHVAVNADLLRRSAAPLPLDAGSGGSVSHLCDVRGCIRAAHLEVTPLHLNNLVRQRCQGPCLIVFGGIIVQETPCPHGRGASHEERLRNSCLGKLMLCSLDHGAAMAVVHTVNGL